MPATLGDINLTIAEATLEANIRKSDSKGNDALDLSWSLSVKTTDDDVVHEGKCYPEPVDFYHETIRFPNQPRRWMDLTGQEVEWDNLDDFGSEDSRPRLYLWGHHLMPTGKIQFVDRNEYDFRVLWEGVSDGYGAFYIDTWVLFEGLFIVKSADDLASMDEALEDFLEPENFIRQPLDSRPYSGTYFKPRL